MDALSQALNAVRVTGAIFFNAEFTAPWGFAAPHADTIAHVLAPGTERLVLYHLVTEGEALVRKDGMADLPLAAGDIVVLPHGDPHRVSNGSPATFMDSAASFDKYLAGDLGTTCYGGGGAATRFVCGFFGCERHADRLFLAGLPPAIRIHIRGDAAGAWLESSIRHLVSEQSSGRPGQEILLSKMAEALFIETLRRCVERLSPEQTGWLAGARDPVVGAALALLHRKPCHRWTMAELAGAVGASRFLPRLGKLPIDEIRRGDISRMLDRAEDESGPVMADRALAALSRVLHWHAARVDHFAVPGLKGMKRTKPKERARDRVLTDDELRRVWGAAGDLAGPWGAFIRMLLLTAARRNEVARMAWDELSGGEWTIPAVRYKTGSAVTLPLSKAALAILDGTPRIESCRFIFSSDGRKPISGFGKRKEKFDKACGVKDWTLHDLRRTARSLMSRAGVPADHAERCLGHVMPGVRGVYDRHRFIEEMRIAFEKLSAEIDGIAK